MGKTDQVATEGVFCMSKYLPGLAGSVDIASGCNNRSALQVWKWKSERSWNWQ